jgi:hypothetical protein
MPHLRKELLQTLASTGSRPNPYRRETIFLQLLLKELRRQVQLESSSADPPTDKEVFLSVLPKDFQPDELAEQALRIGLPSENQIK